MLKIEELWRISRWLEKQETDNPIPSKSKERVFRKMAEGIRKTKSLPKGSCNTCGDIADRLVPMQVKVCRRCLEKIIKKSGRVRIQDKKFIMYYCDFCLGKTLVVFMINPFMCVKCSTKIGKRHKFGMEEIKKLQIKDKAIRPY